MNAPQTIPAPSALDREIEETDTLIKLLERKRHWLRMQREVAELTDDKAKRLYCSYASLAAREDADAIRAGYDLWQVDGLYDLWMDRANETGLEEYPDRAAIVSAGRAAMLTARENVSGASWHGGSFGG